MNVENPEYEALQHKAVAEPSKLVTAMVNRDGQEGGLTLSREHIITLNRYVNHVRSLPSTPDNLQRWLGYTNIDEPELTPEGMEALFDDLRAHAGSWQPLSDASKKLASDLGSTATFIVDTGQGVLDECRSIAKLGSKEVEWEQVRLSKPVVLDDQQRSEVSDLAIYFNVLLESVRTYASKVQAVGTSAQVFRDTAKEKLIPSVHDKRRAVQRKRSDGQIESLRAKLKELDEDISGLNKQYDTYVQAALSGLAAGPIGVAITGGIYGSAAEGVRKERNKRQQERRSVSEQIKARATLEGRMEELATFIDELNSRLDDVVVASGHLHTAWGSIDSYLSASLGALDKISNNHQLSYFVVLFRGFLGQWKKIESQSQQLTRIFDEASIA